MLEALTTFSQVVSWVINIYIWAHIIAILLTWIDPDPYHPAVFYLNQITRPLWQWVSGKVPYALQAFAAYLAILLLLFLQIVIPGWIRTLGQVFLANLPIESGALNAFLYILIAGLSILSSLLFFILILALVWFVITLVNPSFNNPIVRTVMFLVDPLITPIQRLLPRTKTDWSPLVLALGSYLLSQLAGGTMHQLQQLLVA